MAVKKLTEEQKRYIVQALACFQTPEQVAESVNQEFGLKIERQNVAKYDPTKVSGKNLSQGLRDYFFEERKTFRDNLDDIGIAHTSYRLAMLQRMARAAEERKNYPLAAALLEQAAKDRGGVFTNQQKISGRIETNNRHSGEFKHEHRYSPDELRDLPADELVRVHRDTLGVSRARRW